LEFFYLIGVDAFPTRSHGKTAIA